MGRAAKYVEAAESLYSQLRTDQLEYYLFEAIKNLDRRLEAIEPKKPRKPPKETASGR